MRTLAPGFMMVGFCLTAMNALAAESLDVFAGLMPGDGRCWGRSYDQAHLAAHPHQKVTSIDLSIGATPETEFSDGFYIFQLDVALRDGTRGTASGECRLEGDDMFCGVECDGGGIFINAPSQNDMLVDLERIGSISMSSSCGGEEEGFALRSGRDDKKFRLTRMLPQFCMPPEW